MKAKIFLFGALTLAPCYLTQAQDRFVRDDQERFYDWFHQQSQVEDLYSSHTTLYTFHADTEVKRTPCPEASTISRLSANTAVENIEDMGVYVPSDRIGDYRDRWFHVKYWQSSGQVGYGYIWGGNIARAWRKADINADGQQETILLGVARDNRATPNGIKASIKVFQEKNLISRQDVPGLCLFEECSTSPLLRVTAASQLGGARILEASTMTVGCDVGIERAFFIWQGDRLVCVYHGEFTRGIVHQQRPFVLRSEERGSLRCTFRGIGSDFDPEWNTQPLDRKSDGEAVASSRAR